jgi:hypothetical protein
VVGAIVIGCASRASAERPASRPSLPHVRGAELQLGDEAPSIDDYLDLMREVLTPAATVLFENLRRELRVASTPFPERVRARLRPFFDGRRVRGAALAPSIVAGARYTVDAESARQLFALAPTSAAAITVGDVVAFAPGEYQPDCIEGVALIAHELVHVAQFEGLGRDRFLERYFLTEILARRVGADAHGAHDRLGNTLEVDAYCHQAEVCRALARADALPPCRGRETAVCPVCEAREQSR